MMYLIDITFYANHEYEDTSALLAAQHSSVNYREAARQFFRIEIIKHLANRHTRLQEHTGVLFFRGSNHFFHIPFAALRYLHRQKPDLVLVQGMQFPLQVLMLRLALGRKTRILVKHHADAVPGRLKKICWKWADACIGRYLFSSAGNALPWIEAGIISHASKVEEIPATYTDFTRINKGIARQQLGLDDGLHFIWVGRLDANKDPLTLLNAFDIFFNTHPGLQLHVFYKEDGLRQPVLARIQESENLRASVRLHGPVQNHLLPLWFSAADYYISTSHSEAGSAALLEAMACGCIPVITSIPSALKVSANGAHAFHFTPGDPVSLSHALQKAISINRQQFADEVVARFQKDFSLHAVAKKLNEIAVSLLGK